jgi:hypothetical protein
MDILDRIAERRIAESVARGEFDGLPGAGRPLALHDDALVAPEVRVAYRILKNAGYIPEEVGLLAELRSAEQLLVQAIGPEERRAASARLRLLLERLGSSRTGSLRTESDYFERLAERLAGAPTPKDRL